MTKPQTSELICVGAVTGARGIKGDIRIKSFTDDPEAIASYGPLYDKTGTTSFNLKITGQAKGQLIGRVKGINDRNEAEKLKGTQFFVSRDKLPAPDEDEFYVQDLIGLRAEGLDGSDFGKVTAVENYGAGDILEIAGGVVGNQMVPFTLEAFPKVDIEGGLVLIELPAGLMDPPDDEAKDSESSH